MGKFQYVQQLRPDKYSKEPTEKTITCFCCLDRGLIPESVLDRYVESKAPLGAESEAMLVGRPWDPIVSAPMLCSAAGCSAGHQWYGGDGRPNADASLSHEQCTWIASEERKRWADEALSEGGKVADMAARRRTLHQAAAIGRSMPPAAPEPVPDFAPGEWVDF
jgi:hypothetical protein